MQRLRGGWLALLGAILLVTLSVSAAFGADPATGGEGRGQTISAFVHELIFGGTEEQQPEQAVVEDSAEFDDGETAGSHGECVAEVAQDAAAIGGPNENHGGAVSEAARVTCWETDEEEPAPEEELEEEDPEEDPGANAHGQCVSEVARDKSAVGGPNENHGGAVSEAARTTCWETDEEGDDVEVGEPTGELEGDSPSAKEQRKADREAAKAERRAEKAADKANRGNGSGNGRGRGGG